MLIKYITMKIRAGGVKVATFTALIRTSAQRAILLCEATDFRRGLKEKHESRFSESKKKR